MTFTGISPPAAVIGNEYWQGILVAKCVSVDAPGGFVFATNDAGTIKFQFVWMTAAGVMRHADCTPGTGTVAVYDPGTNEMTFAAFDQATSGAAV